MSVVFGLVIACNLKMTHCAALMLEQPRFTDRDECKVAVMKLAEERKDLISKLMGGIPVRLMGFCDPLEVLQRDWGETVYKEYEDGETT